MGRAPAAATVEIGAAYSAAGEAWQRGAAPIYDRMAEVVVGQSPVPLAGRLVLDVGSGTGAVSRAVIAVGGRVIAADAAAGMLAAWPGDRPPAAVADACALPFADGGFDAVVAAFSLTHLTDPASGLREAARVTRPGGPVVVASYAADDQHPAKEAVEGAARELGWVPPRWYEEMRAVAVAQMGSPEAVAALARDAGLDRAVVRRCVVNFGALPSAALVAWRLGMAQLAPFAANLGPRGADRLAQRAVELLGTEPVPLQRPILILTAVR